MGRKVQTPEQLTEAQQRSIQRAALRRVDRLSTNAKKAAEQRDEAIREALKSCSIRAVAEVASLSPARVHQIRHGR
jgi:hypothetical protein